MIPAVVAFALLILAGCTSPPKPADGTEPGRFGRRGNEVILVTPSRTHFFENVLPLCAAWSVPGQWTFASQRAALRTADEKHFVGVAIYPEQRFTDIPGIDVVSRAAEWFRRDAERDFKEHIVPVVEPFDAAHPGAVVWRVTSQVPVPTGAVKEHLEPASKRGSLPSRVLLPFPPGWLTVITVVRDDLETAREVISTLKTVDHPQCWWPLLRQQFPGAVP